MSLVGLCALVDFNDAVQQVQRVLERTLERISSDDGAKTAAIANLPDFLKNGGLVVVDGAAGENDDTPPVKGALHHVPHAVGQRGDWDLVFLVDLFGLCQFDRCGGRLHLDQVSAQLCCDLRRIGAHVHCCLACLGQAAAARVGPHYDQQAL